MTIMPTAMTIMQEREIKTLEQLLITPIRPFEIFSPMF